MSGIDGLLAAVAEAPEGPEVAAVFAVSGGLVDGDATAVAAEALSGSGEVDLAARLEPGIGLIGSPDLGAALSALSNSLSGCGADALEKAVADHASAALRDAIDPVAASLLEAHRERGHTIVIADPQPWFVVEVIAEALAVEGVLCFRPDLDPEGAIATAEGPELNWSAALDDTITGFAEEEGIELDASFAYASGGDLDGITGGPATPLRPDSGVMGTDTDDGEQDWPEETVGDEPSGDRPVAATEPASPPVAQPTSETERKDAAPMSKESTDQAMTWGTERRLNPLDSLMWRAELDPQLRSHGMAFELLDQAPDWDRLYAAHDWASRMVPRFREKVKDGDLGISQPEWVLDENFDLDYHMRRVSLPEGGSFADAVKMAEQFGMTPFDRHRAPWEVMVIEGLPEGKAVYLLKVHHATADGISMIAVLNGLHSRQREHNPNKPQPPAPIARAESPGGLNELIGQLSRDAGSIAKKLTGDSARKAVTRPDKALTEALEFSSSASRVLGEVDAKGSPVLKGRSLSWRFLMLDVRFQDLRAAAKSIGSSLNDAFLAGLLGAMRLYHEEMGQPVDSIPVGIPINVRKEGDPEGGNRIAGGRFAGPVAIEDPVERMKVIRETVLEIRNEPALEAMGMVAPFLSRLPAQVISRLAGSMTADNDLQASNFPGIRDEVYIAGAKIERAYAMGPLPGCATMAVLITHGETACIGVNCDAAAITDPELFGECLVKGFQEVLDLVEDTEPPLLRT